MTRTLRSSPTPRQTSRRPTAAAASTRACTWSVTAFSAIVAHANKSNLSEQPSFYTVLCGDAMEYRVGDQACHNPTVPVRTVLLSRTIFPNGAMNISGITGTSRDEVLVVHFNWLSGHDVKRDRLIAAGMWAVGPDHECLPPPDPSPPPPPTPPPTQPGDGV
mmetsp:Transcript_25981/g.53991  ORF Transcript_25981/g.53991 Transcript_25981/m.53991 type:complete len:162 (-) Transcript_25981:281-766(-)